MSILKLLQRRFASALSAYLDDNPPPESEAVDLDALLDLVRESQDARFGDYQANFPMPLAKNLGKPPRDVAAEVVAQLDVADLCQAPEIAGPGFINLRLRDDWIESRLQVAAMDSQAGEEDRLGVTPVEEDAKRSYVVDYSAPNVAKPMHVGHIRSTVIGDALKRVLRFLGHDVVADNHIGDWGTQFGMILYGYHHFLDQAAYETNPVQELARLYRLVRQLVDYHEGKAGLPNREAVLDKQAEALDRARAEAGDKPDKKKAKELRKAEASLEEARKGFEKSKAKLAETEADPQLAPLLEAHPTISSAVLEETAKLHAGDEPRLALWKEFLPACEEEMARIYRRLDVTFDETLGESYYHDMLQDVVDDLAARELAVESDGAMCVFLEGCKAPMIVRKRDGAFLYATTDLATIRYRMQRWKPSAILYVVDHRQSLHFEQLFGVATKWGYGDVELVHVSFGTVLGSDGRPFKTRAGDTVGLEGLLDEAVARALEVVSSNDDAKPDGPELPPERRREIAETVGIGALKYADLVQNRTSDYVFSYDKMLALTGNTATYMQYAYARVRSIFRRGGVDVDVLRSDVANSAAQATESPAAIRLREPQERALGLAIIRFADALELVVKDYRPNHLTAYLFALANAYSQFFEHCPVLKASDEATKTSRLLLCDLTARTIARGLALLGIKVVEQM